MTDRYSVYALLATAPSLHRGRTSPVWPHSLAAKIATTATNVALRAVPPATIDHLRDSSFENVVFTDLVGGNAPWAVSNSPGVTFLGTTPRP